MTRAAVVLTLALCAGCVVNMGTNTTVTPPEERTPVPDRYEGKAPELVDAGIEGCKRAAALDPNLYYCAAQEQWFRYAMNRWYLAFAWDGNWFPVTGKELPPGLVSITPAPAEVAKSREERLKELENKLDKIDEDKSREEKLKELDKKLEELDKQEAPQTSH